MSDLSGVMCDVIDSDVSSGTVPRWVSLRLVSSIVPLRREEHTSGPHRSRHFENIVKSTATKQTKSQAQRQTINQKDTSENVNINTRTDEAFT